MPRPRRCCVCWLLLTVAWMRLAIRLLRLVRWCAMSRDPYQRGMTWFMLFTVGGFIVLSQIVQRL